MQRDKAGIKPRGEISRNMKLTGRYKTRKTNDTYIGLLNFHWQ
jgi:hypothetical protein